MFNDFIKEYGLTILYAIVTAVAGFLATQFKRLYEQYVNTETKQKCAETVCKAIEQMYQDLHGEEKYLKAQEALGQMLAEKGIIITELECEMLIESAIAEFNKVWDKGDKNES